VWVTARGMPCISTSRASTNRMDTTVSLPSCENRGPLSIRPRGLDTTKFEDEVASTARLAGSSLENFPGLNVGSDPKCARSSGRELLHQKVSRAVDPLASDAGQCSRKCIHPIDSCQHNGRLRWSQMDSKVIGRSVAASMVAIAVTLTASGCFENPADGPSSIRRDGVNLEVSVCRALQVTRGSFHDEDLGEGSQLFWKFESSVSLDRGDILSTDESVTPPFADEVRRSPNLNPGQRITVFLAGTAAEGEWPSILS
jgi:hypothetical protein